MTSERSEDLEPKLAGLPLFSQPLPSNGHVETLRRRGHACAPLRREQPDEQ